MKPFSDSTIRRIAGLIAIGGSGFTLPVGHPDRPIGRYRTWSTLLDFLRSIDPLIPNGEDQLKRLLHDCKNSPQDGRHDFSREDATFEVLKIWNHQNPEFFLKAFSELLKPKNYFPEEHSEILRVYSEIGRILEVEDLFFGGFPPNVISKSNLTPDQRFDLFWKTVWYMASEAYSTDQKLLQKIGPLMLQGSFNDVVRNASESPFDLLKRKDSALADLDGEELIAAALRKRPKLTYRLSDSAQEKWALKRLAAILSQLYQAYRNPSSHHFQINSPWEAMLAVWNADWCIKEIEKLEVI